MTAEIKKSAPHSGGQQSSRPGGRKTTQGGQHQNNQSGTSSGGQAQGARRGGQRRRRSGGGNSSGGSRVTKNISKNWTKAPSAPAGSAQARPSSTPRSNGANKLRVAVMGGCEEVGRNMTMFEYGNDIIFVDAGLQFPEEEMPGIDYIIPDMTYFKGKEKNIRGIVITHAHYDHIGAIPHITAALHNPPIFSARLTLGIIAKRQEDFPDAPRPDLREVDIDGQLKLGDFTVEFIRINHSVPDSLAIVIHTPEGTIIHTGDMKIDLEPIGDQVTDFAKLTRIGNEGVMALMADSTNASKPGHQMSETHIGKTLRGITEKADKRVIVATFASNLNRVQQLLWVAEEQERYVVLEGFSMKTNVEIAKQLGYLEVDRKTIITPQEAMKLPPHKVMIICTGAQGEENASLMRITTAEHRFFKIEEGDMVIFSSSVIPGNERSVQSLKDSLLRQGADIVHYQMMDVHAGGHAQQEDLKLLIRMVKPKFYVPIEGNHHLLVDNAKVAYELGYDKNHVFVPENGQVMEYAAGEGRITEEKLPAAYVFVDGLGVGDVSEVVLRDRQMLSEDGMFVVIVTIDGQTGTLVGQPDIISRGFIYMKGNQALIDEARKEVTRILLPHKKKEHPNPVYLKNKLRDELGSFLFKRIQRRPMVLPVVVEV
ncbi:MAG: ribonuclease J [Candidatus Kerfeldbacteria bacterium CG15_BIG_FIL_POST_REV_8_21_14_020_45_12]|uniref:Ribonuclease J n=1 Tax=Candidatus Kerfeldbacteria bacterium CG15_BIG_FIL_POST_REV_8_21_14_020_45_12 TaxID=2014247 RepID=A0A2M7H2F7_9BACT|nr:MAG: ribonuclease J [Candidatus Kerfeldbacteria bacterium CG15_BIG_FIL_POST_REV_8_21_14_020_45_12]PJA93528.1 MAG: ribonuclease J [Candidatus Kerfeldbacteria bacterium CG_4_9_14_3_um_filter_45_8]